MISKRIKTIASLLPPAKIIADVGCDHGYLIIEAFDNYNISQAIAIDNKKMPLQKAIDNISKYDFSNQVSFKLSDGLEKLSIEADAIILSGMGGLLILEILNQGLDKLKNAKLIIQPNRNSYDVRKELSKLNYQIKDEKIVNEDKKYYEIIVLEKTTSSINYTEQELTFGPILLKQKEQIFIEKLRNDLRILENINYQTQGILEKIEKIKELL